jgi:hypothetical protein
MFPRLNVLCLGEACWNQLMFEKGSDIQGGCPHSKVGKIEQYSLCSQDLQHGIPQTPDGLPNGFILL